MATIPTLILGHYILVLFMRYFFLFSRTMALGNSSHKLDTL